MNSIFISCPKGNESLLRDEAGELGLQHITETTGGISGEADVECLYRICLWSRLASRVLLVLADQPVSTFETLESHLKNIDWSEHLRVSGTFKVNFAGELKDINNELFGAMRVKDVIVDQFRERTGLRPTIQKTQPDVCVDVRVRKGRARIALDLSGDPLHRRGYRLDGAKAPLKENLAAAILIRAGWPDISKQQGSLIDPMCGSGTLLIEAAWMAGDRAPGLSRQYWGFSGWLGHSPSVWVDLISEARARREKGDTEIPPILGYDADQSAIMASITNIERAGLKGKVWSYRKELSQWQLPTHMTLKAGLLVCNPPYGERLGEQQALKGLYRYLGQIMDRDLQGWRASIFTGNVELAKSVGFRAYKQYRLNNGPLDCKLFNFHIDSEWKMKSMDNSEYAGEQTIQSIEDLSPGAQMVANRIKKNIKALKPELKKHKWQAYRIYDADIPEYSAAIDIYGDWVHVAEYQAPSEIPEEKTKARLVDIVDAVPAATGIPHSRVVLKERSRQKGRKQYTRLSKEGKEFAIQEHGVNLLVNMSDYLDTGLFLDHRPVRLMIQEMSRGKDVLNLYCYTASVTAHAAVGGAKSTISIDLSKTYLNWARRNLDANGISDSKHKLIESDCRTWLKDPKNRNKTFDLIFMDPPTFSNSKKTYETLDIQRDHAELIQLAMARLNPQGVLIFSNNRRGFKLDDSISEHFSVADISQQTIPKDFKRNLKIHQCWKIENQ